MLLPFQGECVQSCCSRGAATLCPGLCACCPIRGASIQGAPILPLLRIQIVGAMCLSPFSRRTHPMSRR